MNLEVKPVTRREFEWLLINHHYASRVPNISHAIGLFNTGELIGVATFGTPASRHLQLGVCPENPALVIELNRLCVLDCAPRNTETWFLARALKMLPPRIIVSYADTIQGHMGYVYRAANFLYAGWTDMERKTPRYDYVVPGMHTRQAFREGKAQFTEKVRRRPKVKYWTVTGNKREQRAMRRLCRWPSLSWVDFPPPTEHRQFDGPFALLGKEGE